MLRSELIRVISGREELRIISKLPSGPGSAISDLSISAGSDPSFEWSFRNQADYDQNGEVNISDLTPIGVHFKKTPAAADWTFARLADGDDNGEINIADVTPIGVNFLSRINGYSLEFAASEDSTDWTMVAEIPVAEGDASGGRRHFSHVLAEAAEGWYRLRIFENGASGKSYGDPSNLVQLVGENHAPSAWSEPGGGPGNPGYSSIAGPASLGNVQRLLLAENYRLGPYIGSDGSIHVAAAAHAVLKLDSAGNQLWKVPLDGSPTVLELANGDISLCATDTGKLYCIADDSSLLLQHDAGMRIGALARTPAGRTIAVLGDGSARALDDGGSVAWNYSSPGRIIKLVEAAANGNIYLLSSRADVAVFDPNQWRLQCLDADGNELWLYDGVEDSLASGGNMQPGVDSQEYFYDGNWLYAVNSNGSEAWKSNSYEIGAWDVDTLGNIYLGTVAGLTDYVAILGPEGVSIESWPSPGDVWSGLRVGPDGRIWWNDAVEGFKSRAHGAPGGDFGPLQLGTGLGSGDVDGNFFGVFGSQLRRIANDGSTKWTKGDADGIAGQPVFAADGTAYIGAGAKIKALDTGWNEKWSDDAGFPLVGSPLIREDGSIIAAFGQYVASQFLGLDEFFNPIYSDPMFEGAVRAYDPQGGLLWSHEESDMKPGQPRLGADGSVFFIAGNATADCVHLDVNGNELWRNALSGNNLYRKDLLVLRHSEDHEQLFAASYLAGAIHVRSLSEMNDLQYDYDYPDAGFNTLNDMAAGSGGRLYLLLSGKLQVLENDGNASWDYASPAGSIYSIAVNPDGRVVMGAGNNIAALDDAGQELFSLTADEGSSTTYITALTVDSSGRMYGIASGGAVFCFDETGMQLWKTVFSLEPFTYRVAPAIGPDGSVYVSLINGEIVRVK
ncbi:hypothetical protein KDL29_13015 [bacterium]|nr:hypothetical protein [bacterium]